MQVLSLGQEDLLEKEMATHSSTLAWKIPWTEKPGRLQSMGCSRQEYWSGHKNSDGVIVINGRQKRKKKTWIKVEGTQMAGS